MKNAKKFKEDYTSALVQFPLLKECFYKDDAESWVIKGDLDICDTKGEYWETFNIAIVVPDTYPFCVPVVVELSQKIPRDIDRHISDYGECCLDIEHQLLHMKKKGINILDFIRSKIYPYFANQVCFDQLGKYYFGEYSHGFSGIQQFYKESLGIMCTEDAILILNGILEKKKMSRNMLCLCQKKKYKKCHLKSIEFLISVGYERLKEDLDGFLYLSHQSASIN